MMGGGRLEIGSATGQGVANRASRFRVFGHGMSPFFGL